MWREVAGGSPEAVWRLPRDESSLKYEPFKRLTQRIDDLVLNNHSERDALNRHLKPESRPAGTWIARGGAFFTPKEHPPMPRRRGYSEEQMC